MFGSMWRSVSSAVCVLAALCVFTGDASASPWTVPRDELVLSLSYDFQSASSEYTPTGVLQSFPLQGEFASSSVSLGGRYGFTDKFEGFFNLSFKQASYSSDPFLANLADDPNVEDTRDALLNFSDTAVGAGDLILGGRYNLYRKNLVMALEVKGKFPTNYDDPTGMNVTLGDGQMDLQPSYLLGVFIPQTYSFVRADVGYNARLGGPGHQAVGAFKLGQFIGQSVILFAGVDAAYTLFEGAAVEGESNYVATSPEKSTREFGPDDFEIVPLRLDRDFARVDAGLIFRVRTLEFQVSYNRLVYGRNIPLLSGLNVSSVVALPDVTAPVEEEAAEPSEEGEEDEVIIEEIVEEPEGEVIEEIVDEVEEPAVIEPEPTAAPDPAPAPEPEPEPAPAPDPA